MTSALPTPPVLTVTCRSEARPCRALRGLSERLARCGGRVRLDVRPAEADTPLTATLPLLTLRQGGRILGTLLAPRSAAEVCRWVRATLPPPRAKVLREARRLLRASRADEAAALLRGLPVPADRGTTALLARALAFREPAEALRLAGSLGARASGDAAIAICLARAVLRADSTGTGTALEADYLRALCHLRDQHFMTAAAGLMDVLDVDPRHDAGEAAAACAALFAHLGPRHPVSVQHHARYTLHIAPPPRPAERP